jgi:hypothetical protein
MPEVQWNVSRFRFELSTGPIRDPKLIGFELCFVQQLNFAVLCCAALWFACSGGARVSPMSRRETHTSRLPTHMSRRETHTSRPPKPQLARHTTRKTRRYGNRTEYFEVCCSSTHAVRQPCSFCVVCRRQAHICLRN